MTGNEPFNILFLCTGNAARSIMAEAIVNHHGNGRFRGYSAGSFPRGEVHPHALDLLRSLGYGTQGLRSKSWDEFAGGDAVTFDFVFTVCDDAAEESCPVWPGQPMTAHWGVPDPARAVGTDAERRLAFADAFRMLDGRLQAFMSLPIESLNRTSLENRLNEIGRQGDEASAEAAR